VGKTEGRGHLEDTGVDGRMDLQEVECEFMDWFDMTQLGTGGGHF